MACAGAVTSIIFDYHSGKFTYVPFTSTLLTFVGVSDDMSWVRDIDAVWLSTTFDVCLSSGGVGGSGGRGSFDLDAVLSSEAGLFESSVETPEDWAWALKLLRLDDTSDASFGGVGNPFVLRTALKFGACSLIMKLLAGLWVIGIEDLRSLDGVRNGSATVELSKRIGGVS